MPLVNSVGLARKTAIQNVRGFSLNFKILPVGEGAGAVQGVGALEHGSQRCSQGSGKALAPLTHCCQLSQALLDPHRGIRFYWYQ